MCNNRDEATAMIQYLLRMQEMEQSFQCIVYTFKTKELFCI